MKFLLKVGILCTTLIITSCATISPQLPEIQIPPERILQNGYSFVPLNEKGWKIVGRNAYQLAFAKTGDNQDETFAIQTFTFGLPEHATIEEFIRIIKEGQTKDTNPQRFKMTEHEVTAYPMKGADCAKSHVVTEDNAAVKRSVKSENMILEAMTLTCAHPSNKNVGISIVYSQRYYPGQRDPALVEKATSILNSTELNDPEHSYPTSLKQPESDSAAAKFVTLCSEILNQSSAKITSQLQSPPTDVKQETDSDSVYKLASMGISIGRVGSTKENGSYALFEKDSNGDFSLAMVKSSFIEPNTKNQEVLFVSQRLDNIAPAFASFDYREPRQAFLCGTGAQGLTGINSSGRTAYNPCDSYLTSSSIGSSILMNTLLTVATFGANVVTGSTATFVDTNKEKVARLVINSKLFLCLKEANLKGLKDETATLK